MNAGEFMSIFLPEQIRSVCFTGHRDPNRTEAELITRRLDSILTLLAESRGLRDCYAGGAIGLDTLAALTVIALKPNFPELRLNLILPCAEQEKSWNTEQKALYNYIKSRADSVRVLSPFFYNGCMQARNRQLLLSADLCIAYMRKGTSSGGTLNTIIQASKLGVPVINIADPESEYIK